MSQSPQDSNSYDYNPEYGNLNEQNAQNGQQQYQQQYQQYLGQPSQPSAPDGTGDSTYPPVPTQAPPQHSGWPPPQQPQ